MFRHKKGGTHSGIEIEEPEGVREKDRNSSCEHVIGGGDSLP